jgi:hypothetical protein
MGFIDYGEESMNSKLKVHSYTCCCFFAPMQISTMIIMSQAGAMLVVLIALFSTTPQMFVEGQAGFTLRVIRPLRLNNNPNLIIMECRDSSDDTLVLDALYFRNGLQYELPNAMVVNRVGVRFVVDRSSEGNFTCGTGEESFRSSPPITIIGKAVPALGA